MSRLALYRKWRPMTFHDVVEQRHVVDTLKNSLKNDAIGHAYLFCGTRGTGKTTMAKIFSRAINCLNPKDGDPCNECSICQGILNGSILDVMEMDAASNNSVDNIRDIRDEVVYAPSVARYKVYIIDEVHMLSSGAFNALLKTLEEPPERVVFILATTEPQKLPATVLSRCQRFDFKRITEHGIAERLGEIAVDCGITVAPDALHFLARLSGGAMRDAISLLDQLTTLGHTAVTLADVNEMAGFASNARIRTLAGALLEGDIDRSWTLLDELMREGRDLSQLCVQLLGWFRNALLLQMGGASSPLLDLHPDDMPDAKKAAETLKGSELAEWLRELSEHELRLRRTDNPRIMMEVLLLRLCTRSTGKSGDGHRPDAQEQNNGKHPMADGAVASGRELGQMEDRLARLERQLADMGQALSGLQGRGGPAIPGGGSPGVSSGNSAGTQSARSGAYGARTSGGMSGDGTSASGQNDTWSGGLGGNAGQSGSTPVAARQSGTGNDGSSYRGGPSANFQTWARVIDEIRRTGTAKPGGMKLYAYILDTECLQVAPDQLRVVVSADDFLKRKVLSQSDSIGMITAAVQAVTGQACQIKIVDMKEATSLKAGTSAVPNVASGNPAVANPIPAITEPDMQVSERLTPVMATPDGSAGSSPHTRPERKEKGENPFPDPQVSDSDDAFFGSGAIPDAPEEHASTGDSTLDRLLDFGREAGISIQIKDEADS